MTSMSNMEDSARELENAATDGFEELQRWALEVSASSRNPLASVFVNCIKTSVGPALDEWEGELSTRGYGCDLGTADIDVYIKADGLQYERSARQDLALMAAKGLYNDLRFIYSVHEAGRHIHLVPKEPGLPLLGLTFVHSPSSSTTTSRSSSSESVMAAAIFGISPSGQQPAHLHESAAQSIQRVVAMRAALKVLMAMQHLYRLHPVSRLEMKQLIDRSSADSHKAEFGAILVNALESIMENSGELQWRNASKRMLQLLQASRPGQGVRKH